MAFSQHIPVLLEETLQYLDPHPGLLYVDATLGGGGHGEAILSRLFPAGQPHHGTLLGLDQDAAALLRCQERFTPFQPADIRLVHSNFAHLSAVLQREGLSRITGGILADIGVSSFQLDQGERGFSFSKPAPLDMRMDATAPLTAEEIINTYAESDLVEIFSHYGEERLSKTIAREIVQQRRTEALRTTQQLAELVCRVYSHTLKGERREPKREGDRGRIHPATQVFQALRIAVNDELQVLESFLEQLPACLAPGSRVVVISFHSLEDRIVKRHFQQESRDCLCPPRLPVCQCGHQAQYKILTPKPVLPSEEERQRNPRSRSAKLRAAVKL